MHGSWLALIALVINLALAFGHVHAIGGKTPERSGVLVTAISGGDGGQNRHHPSDSHPDYLCPICMATAVMGNGLTPTPPALQVEFAEARIDQPIDHFRFLLQLPRAAFESRGPPIS
ncbi:DUF2946 family protein [Bradyrhizobium tropiciagri]|uniref:DUF2946 family protein n=1 Tax=Bradyrhizobium tropiciagri TaxID=312253 RepID=UPI000A4267DA|nr:DUF2946 family protein [Bradyrhizobium tropiciagri]